MFSRMRSLLGLFCFLGCGFAITYKDVLFEEWTGFKLEHGKVYHDEVEEMFRRKIYVENKHKIAAHNVRYLQGTHTYTLAMNKYGDLLHHEFVAKMNGFKRNYRDRLGINASAFIRPENVHAPKEIDWRLKGAVTQVKDQGQCGSCWAFSSTGSLEGQHERKTGKLVSLSEQNLIDCSKNYGNDGCGGGLMDQAFAYIKDNKGIDTEESYPYEGVDGVCRFKRSTIGATCTGFVDIISGNETDLLLAVATVGPVSVAIDASHESFQFYSKGVYNELECSAEQLDHGVLAVGYGTLEGQDYWLVKNSWGVTWGDKGYIKMSRNMKNQCGIATSASYPLV